MMSENLFSEYSHPGARIILGCMRLASASVNKVSRLIDTARDNGIVLFDHADIYGKGESERLFGDALKQSGINRDRILIQTKCGIRPGRYDLTKNHIIDSLNGSLKRLQTGYTDILLLHRPDTLMEPEEIAAAFRELKDSGKVRHFGVSNFNSSQMALLQQSCDEKLMIDQLQFGPAHTGLIDAGFQVNTTWDGAMDRNGHILDYCRLHHITVQTWSPLLYGYFEGNILDAGTPYENLRTTLREIAEENGLSVTAVIAAWILRHPAGMQMITGTTDPEHLQTLCAGAHHKLSREDWYRLYISAGNTLP